MQTLSELSLRVGASGTPATSAGASSRARWRLAQAYLVQPQDARLAAALR